MISLTAMTRIYLYRGACDMRKSFDGLCGIIRSELEMDPLSGSLFVFVNGNRKMVKLLYWDQDGLVLWYKRLEEGKFIVPDKSGSIDRRDLTLLLEGIVPKRIEKRYVGAHSSVENALKKYEKSE